MTQLNPLLTHLKSIYLCGCPLAGIHSFKFTRLPRWKSSSGKFPFEAVVRGHELYQLSMEIVFVLRWASICGRQRRPIIDFDGPFHINFINSCFGNQSKPKAVVDVFCCQREQRENSPGLRWWMGAEKMAKLIIKCDSRAKVFQVS